MAHPRLTDRSRTTVKAALDALGKRNLVLGLFDPSFPGHPEDDPGRGSPYGRGGHAFLRFTAQLGFNGLQLGPQGQTPEDNPSPYDSTQFSRSFLSIPLTALTEPAAWGPALLPSSVREAVVAGRPAGSDRRAAHAYAYRALLGALREAWAELRRRQEAGRAGEAWKALEAFGAQHGPWLTREALYGALSEEHGEPWWRAWRRPDGSAHPDQRLWAPLPGEEEAQARRRAELLARYADTLAFHTFVQALVHAQHAQLRQHARGLGLKLFGDLQIGFAAQDVWASQALFLPGYLMGAPPSRTNAEGQAWNYPVLDPALLGTPAAPGPAVLLVRARLDKALAEYDGVRLDHPHGLVDPWVYRDVATEASDVLRQVQAGARLRSSPHLPDHPRLAAFAVPAPEQLNPSPATPRYADDWVVSINEEQEARYAILFDTIVAAAQARGRAREDLVCEVLSTQPYPLARVMARHGLGRFRVTQKADPHRPWDVYRSENAHPHDWIMVGNHDTPPLARLLEEWQRRPEVWRAQAEMLAARLEPREGAPRAALAEALQASPRRMAEAKFADVFASRAENVYIFFADLYGLKDLFNAPGTVGPENWSLRLPPDAESLYFERVARGEALNLPRVLALALRARQGEAADPGLLAALDEEARVLEPGA